MMKPIFGYRAPVRNCYRHAEAFVDLANPLNYAKVMIGINVVLFHQGLCSSGHPPPCQLIPSICVRPKALGALAVCARLAW